MPTLTIPKQTFKKADLVLIQRREYEDLIRAREELAQKTVVKRSSSFRVSKKNEGYYDELDKRLTSALQNMERGNFYGPFKTAADGQKFVESIRKPKI